MSGRRPTERSPTPGERGAESDPSDAPTALPHGPLDIPEHIGPYRILEKIGEGGMGSVFLAEQETPVRRRVALKLLKPGMDSKEVLARFESERQALALMSHPHIARVYEAGSTEQGLPYFAMEHVPGESITAYCDRHKLRTAERVELFVPVCEGVQHAHQKGIIHRDLKPSNVLVAMQDGRPEPKIIDFGVAKATNQRLTEQTVYTKLGVLIGTPEYMSPEQAELTGLDIDTRTDVYSLGVILYELLAGVLPFDSKELRGAGFDGLVRMIREQDPPRPSTKVTTLGEGSDDALRSRRTTLPALRKDLSGDLDWITMRALEKDRTRRYDSPAELAADLRRHLHHEPVLAGPPSQVYRLKKFVRRHRLGVAAGGFIALALLAGLAAATYGMVQARRAQVQALQEAATAEQVTEFVVGLFEWGSPEFAQGRTVTAREVIDRGAVRITTELEDQPAVRARLENTLGRVYTSLGQYDSARPLLEAALASRREMFGERSVEVAETLHALAGMSFWSGELETAGSRVRESLEIRREQLGNDHLDVAAGLHLLGMTIVGTGGDPEEAEEVYREALTIRRARLGATHPLVGDTLAELGGLYSWNLQDYESGETLLLEGLRLQRNGHGEDHPGTLYTMLMLGNHFLNKGDYPAAQRYYVAGIEGLERVLGGDHEMVAGYLSDLAAALIHTGRLEEAKGLLASAIRIQRGIEGGGWGRLPYFLVQLARIEHTMGNIARAEELYREALAEARALDRPLSPSYRELARVRRDAGDLHGAESLCREAVTAARKENPRAEMASLTALGLVLLDSGVGTEANDVASEALELLHEHTPTTFDLESLYRKYHKLPPIMLRLAELLDGSGDTENASDVYVRTYSLQRAIVEEMRQQGQPWHRIAGAKSVAGACLMGLRRFEEAEPLVARSLEDYNRIYGRRSLETRDAIDRAIVLYEAWGRLDRAAVYRQMAERARNDEGPR